MAETDERTLLAGALKSYLQELKESGVDELVYGTPSEKRVISHAFTASAFAESSSAATPVPKAETLADVRRELGTCSRCSLSETRKNIVFGSGECSSGLLFVGEAPGGDEDLQGEPFVGEAGQLLTKMIKAMGYERSQVYIGNVLKCRPPEDRKPLPAEIAACNPFLQRQIKAMSPKVIVALGTFASQTLLCSKEPISRLRGHFHDYQGIPLMPTFHPAFLIRSPEKKREVWADLQQVMKLLV